MKSETLEKIAEAAKKFGIDKHPGFKDILQGCTAWGLNLENAEVKIETTNGKDRYLVISEKKYESPKNGYRPSEYLAVIEKKDNNNIVLSIIQKLKQRPKYKQENGREVTGPEKEYMALKEIRNIDENGIERKRTLEIRNIDNVMIERETIQRRGLQEIFYTKEEHFRTTITGIGAIEYYPEHNAYYQKLDYTSPPETPTICNSVSDKELQECFKHLTEKQKEGLMKLHNSSFTVSQLMNETNTKKR